MDQEIQQSTNEKPEYSVPWSILDSWLEVILLIIIDILVIVFILRVPTLNSRKAQGSSLPNSLTFYLLS
jgi:hypothetical protein